MNERKKTEACYDDLGEWEVKVLYAYRCIP